MDETCRCKVANKIAIELLPCTESEFEPNPRKSSLVTLRLGHTYKISTSIMSKIRRRTKLLIICRFCWHKIPTKDEY